MTMRLRQHLNTVDWRAVAVDTAIGIVAVAMSLGGAHLVGYHSEAAGFFLVLIGAYGILEISCALWEIAQPESKARKAEIRRHEQQSQELFDELMQVYECNEHLGEANSNLLGRNERFGDALGDIESAESLTEAREMARDALDAEAREQVA